jgi:hypothetical protein
LHGCALSALAGLLLFCRTKEHTNDHPPVSSGSSVSDSLILTNGEGVEIWFTLARQARGPGGVRCVERGLEIRRGDSRIKVPLLYTGAAPVLLNPSTMRAELWNHCQPVDTYLVDLQSGRPVRQRGTR